MRSLIRLQKIFLITTYSLFAFVSSASGQESNRQTPAEQTDEVIRINTDLVQTDVMVFDKQGRFVDGLQREQFELTVDGKPQPISFFNQVRVGSANEENQRLAARGGAAAAVSSTGKSTAETLDRGRTIVFFLDDAHLSLSSMERTRKMLTHFVENQMNWNDRVAIASTSGQIGFLQQFTDYKPVLRAAIKRLVQRPYAVHDDSEQGAPMTEYMAYTIERKGDPSVFDFYVDECLKYNAPPPGVIRPRASCEMQVTNRARLLLLQAASAVSNTYASLESLMRSSAQLPGRKLAFFISDGFLLDTGVRNSDPRNELGRITDAAQRAGVVIYTIDARGLVSGQLDATNSVPFDPNGRLESASLREIPASQDALNALAEDTGGRALRNQNFFDAWVTKVLDETSNYYLLAWRPDNEKQTSGNFRNVKVRVIGRPELTVRLPRGYLKSSPALSAKRETKAPREALKASPQEQAASPGAFEIKSGVPTSLSVVYLDTPENGAVLTASVQVANDALVYDTAGNKPVATVDVAGVILNDKGKQAGNFKTRLNINALDSTAAAKGQDSGTIYNYKLPLKPGLYQVRVAARDAKSGRAGSAMQWIEVPDLALRHLALSSLLIGVQKVETVDKQSAAATSPQLQFSVNHHFARNSRLRFMTFIYNAARGTKVNNSSDVTLQAQLLRANKIVLNSPPRKVSEQEQDASRILYAGEIALNSLPAGRYLLQLIATDRITGTSALQQSTITIE